MSRALICPTTAVRPWRARMVGPENVPLQVRTSVRVPGRIWWLVRLMVTVQ